MSKMTPLTLACLLAAAAIPARADDCTSLQQTAARFCASDTYSNGAKNKYTVTFGPGNAFYAAGASKNDLGVVATGTFSCPGNNFYEADYSDSEGESSIIQLGRLPSAVQGKVISGPFGAYQFSAQMKPGACN